MAQIKISHSFAYECYCCRKFFVRPDKHKNMESCSGAPGIVCNFTSKNLVTFEDNFSAKGNLPMAIHFVYETTAPIDNNFDPEQKKMSAVFYVLILVFHPHLNIRKKVQRSYRHSLK